MSYEIDELFDIIDGKYDGKAFVWSFLKPDDPTVTRVEIPAEYHGYPVRSMHSFCFADCDYLQEVIFPDSVEKIDRWTFHYCPELREVRLPKNIEIDMQAFTGCPKLNAEVVMAGLVGSNADLSAPFSTEEVLDEDVLFSAEDKLDWQGLLRPDVFELTVKYDSFRLIGTERLYREIVLRGLVSHFKMLEQAGRSPDVNKTDALIRFSVENKITEITAYLLDYKNRKFGFSGGDNFEL